MNNKLDISVQKVVGQRVFCKDVKALGLFMTVNRWRQTLVSGSWGGQGMTMAGLQTTREEEGGGEGERAWGWL